MHYQVNSNYVTSGYFNTLISILGAKNPKIADVVKDHDKHLSSITDNMLYGSVRKDKQKTDAEMLAKKIEFLKQVHINKIKG